IAEMRATTERRPGALVVLNFSIVALLIPSACSNEAARKAKADSLPRKETAVPVQVFTAASREVRRTVEAVGSLFPYDEVVVSAEVDGRAEKVLVDVGDRVTKGQT